MTLSVGTALDDFVALEPAAGPSVFDAAGHDLGSEGRVADVFTQVDKLRDQMLISQHAAQAVCEQLLSTEAGEGLAREIGPESAFRIRENQLDELVTGRRS
jgi:hypothetical protein